eukprot:TRINITY_DN49094_c0_g2_i1.p1 TRINITY_DN49094_c0_g2~~TRINITY_DN49094_c0_g2_i1.p1  ORF type:complete len:461 (-),score=31.62 TRINITY_DN49094_c0_g2_i1:73-1455(-)
MRTALLFGLAVVWLNVGICVATPNLCKGLTKGHLATEDAVQCFSDSKIFAVLFNSYMERRGTPFDCPITLLIPSDKVFKARFPRGALATLLLQPEDDTHYDADDFVEQHILLDDIPYKKFIFSKYKSAGGGDVQGIMNNGKLHVAAPNFNFLTRHNVATLTSSIQTKNGWVHWISDVLEPPTDSPVCDLNRPCDPGTKCVAPWDGSCRCEDTISQGRILPSGRVFTPKGAPLFPDTCPCQRSCAFQLPTNCATLEIFPIPSETICRELAHYATTENPPDAPQKFMEIMYHYYDENFESEPSPYINENEGAHWRECRAAVQVWSGIQADEICDNVDGDMDYHAARIAITFAEASPAGNQWAFEVRIEQLPFGGAFVLDGEVVSRVPAQRHYLNDLPYDFWTPTLWITRGVHTLEFWYAHDEEENTRSTVKVQRVGGSELTVSNTVIGQLARPWEGPPGIIG